VSGCCGAPAGFERVWVWKRVGQETVEFDNQADAMRARAAADNAGTLKRITRRVT
jgi:hypothetical protein